MKRPVYSFLTKPPTLSLFYCVSLFVLQHAIKDMADISQYIIKAFNVCMI